MPPPRKRPRRDEAFSRLTKPRSRSAARAGAPGAADRPAPANDRSGRALVLHPARKRGGDGARTPAARLDEAVGLARAIGLDVVRAEVVPLHEPRPATLFGAGKVDELKGVVAAEAIEVAVVDAAVTPVQQRNLEKAWGCKVIDRTGLILEIFGERARTREGRLQVELAHLTYQRSRLVRSWTHLERQRGGFGFLGGPGESQLEIDRRLIGERIGRIRADLDKVVRTRGLHRRSRRKVPYPVVALVGYTNAGKSTLFNRLTRADVFAENLLFATLDPTMRGLELPDGRRAILSDTVGFISDLPTHLIAAFRATLEEVLAADVIVHVRDIAHPETDAQAADVRGVLADLGLDEAAREAMIEALNKIDLLPADQRDAIVMAAGRNADVVPLSALTGEGCDRLLARLAQKLVGTREVVDLAVDLADGATLAWLYRHGEVIDRTDRDGQAHLRVGLDAADIGRFRKRAGAEARH